MALYFAENIGKSLNEQVDAVRETSYYSTSSYSNDYSSFDQEQQYDFYNPKEHYGNPRQEAKPVAPTPPPKPKPSSAAQIYQNEARDQFSRQTENTQAFKLKEETNPLQRPRDNRVFGANYRPPQVALTAQKPPEPAKRQASLEITLQKPKQQPTESTMQYQNQYGEQDQFYNEQRRQDQMRSQGYGVPLQNGNMNGQHYEEPQAYDLRPYTPPPPNEAPRLTLHQGSVVQFPSKMPDPSYKAPDGSHLGEEKNKIDLHCGTVLQFQTNIPDFSHKPAEGSHLGEEKDLIQLHRGTVLQFPSHLPDPNHKPPEGAHMSELEMYEHLRLKQGSVLQFPSEIRETKVGDFVPPQEPMKETLPTAESVRQNHLLPSEARRQQAYLVHPNQNSRPPSGMSSAPGSPSMSRKYRQQWPPRSNEPGRFNAFIAPEGGKKTFMWPPPKADMYRSYQDLTQPDGHGTAGSVWRPESPSVPRSYRQPIVGRQRSVWPPPSRERVLVKQSSLPETKSKKVIEFDEHIIYHAGVNVPVCYRVPPGTQFYEEHN